MALCGMLVLSFVAERCDAQTIPQATITQAPVVQPESVQTQGHERHREVAAGNQGTFSVSESDAKASVQWLADLVVRRIPKKFDGDKDWGNTKRIWAGVKVRRDGFRIKTNRRFREVDHGRWIRYELTMPGPNDRPAISIDRVTRITNPSSASHRQEGWRIESTMTAPMRFSARVERWNYGLQWYSVSITGHLRIAMRCDSTVHFVPDYTAIPPALVVDPNVERAELVLEDFEVERISKVGGDVAEAWGEIIQEVIRERIRRKENASLAEKLNRAINEHRDDLRLSMFDAAKKWFGASARQSDQD